LFLHWTLLEEEQGTLYYFNPSSAFDVDLFQTLMTLKKGQLEYLLVNIKDLDQIVQSSKYGCLELARYYIKGILNYARGFMKDSMLPTSRVQESESESE
jgi:hypothetical protein